MRKFILLFLMGTLASHLSIGQAEKNIHPAAIKKSMIIFPEQPEHAHGSSIVQFSNGDMLVAWFQGNGERTADNVRIMGARMKATEKKWSEPFIMADTYQIPDCNPVLFLNHQGKLFLVWIAVLANKWENSVLVYKTSDDYLKSGAPIWNKQDNIFLKPDSSFYKETVSKFKELPENTAGWSGFAPEYDAMIIDASRDLSKRSLGWMTRIHPLLLEDKKILLPLYSDGYNFSLIAISENDGLTWRPSLPIIGRGNVQPSLVQKKNGDLVAFMRDNGDAPGRVQLSTSRNNGETWSAAEKSDIPNIASVQVKVLKNGNWAFVGNVLNGSRHKLSLWISNDEGKTWKSKMFLEDEEKGKGSFSYPSMIQGMDGLLHITYSYKKGTPNESIKYVAVDASLIK